MTEWKKCKRCGKTYPDVVFETILKRTCADCSWKRFGEKIEDQYGMTLDIYMEILVFQKGVCAICEEVPWPGKKLGIDHCHKTGKNRGLLCNKCNSAIGLLREVIKFFERAIEYLRNPVIPQFWAARQRVPSREGPFGEAMSITEYIKLST